MNATSVVDRPIEYGRMAKSSSRRPAEQPDEKLPSTMAVSFRIPRELYEELEKAARLANMEIPQFMRFCMTSQMPAFRKIAEKVADALSNR